MKLGIGLAIVSCNILGLPLSLGILETPIAQAQTSALTDLQGYWGQAYVDALANRGYIGGFPDGTFRPNAYITRAEFAAIAAKALGLPAASGGRVFVDVPSTHWAAGAIAAVSNSGLVGGFPDGTFRPSDRITRAQSLVILTKALQNTNPDPSGLNRYGDVAAVPEWANDSLSRAANAGIIVNFPNPAVIEPNRVSTRGEVAALMYQTLYQLGMGNLSALTIGSLGTPPTPTGNTGNQPSTLTLSQVTLSPDRPNLTAGDELIVRAVGTPQATARFTVEGIGENLPMTEQEPGTYQGSYTVKRSDNQAQARVFVTLDTASAEPVTQAANRTITLDAQGPEIREMQPANLALTPNRQPDITAILSDGIGSGVNPRGVQLLVNGQDVTGQATITANFMAYRPPSPLTGDRVTVDLRVADQLGNVTAQSWTFGFGDSTTPTGQPTTLLFPQVTNVAPNATVAFPVTLVGSTAPNAQVLIKVDAFTSLLGVVGVSQTVLNTQVQADAAGQFTVQLQPASLTSGGTRYRVQLVGVDGSGNRSPQNEFFLTRQ